MHEPRKTRRDKGMRIMKSRDTRVLCWIAEQYALRLDHLRHLLSREPGHTSERFAPGAAGISDSAIIQVIGRWAQEPAWAEYKRFYVDTPGWVWTTAYGVEVLASQGLIPAYGRHTLRESTLAHLHAINAVRLNIELRHPEHRWVSERSLRKLLGRRVEGDDLVHLPDAQVWLDEQRAVAVEVELSPKSAQEYDAIFDELLVTGVALPDGSVFRYKTVWYIVNQATSVHVQARRMVEDARARLAERYRRLVQVIELETLVQAYETHPPAAVPPTSPTSSA